MNRNSVKKTGWMLLLSLVYFSLGAQVPSYNQLVSVISSKLPGIDVSHKVIAFVSWSAAGVQSRETNKEFNRVGSIYQGAKLRNGSKGAFVISCSTDNQSMANIAFNKDGIDFSIRITASEFAFLSGVPAGVNAVYDATGAKVYENLGLADVFSSFNRLITR